MQWAESGEQSENENSCFFEVPAIPAESNHFIVLRLSSSNYPTSDFFLIYQDVYEIFQVRSKTDQRSKYFVQTRYVRLLHAYDRISEWVPDIKDHGAQLVVHWMSPVCTI